MEKKMTTPVEVLCKGLPNDISLYMNYSKSLRFEDKPDYQFLKKIFKELFIKMNYTFDYMYDWSIIAQQKGETVNFSNGKINI